MDTIAKQIVADTGYKQECIEAIAEHIANASRDADNWCWGGDSSCGGHGFGEHGLLNGGRGMMWCGTLSIAGIGDIEFGACVDVDSGGAAISFGSGCRDADIGNCIVAEELIQAFDGIVYGEDDANPEEILADSAWEALSQLSGEGLAEIVEAECRQCVDIDDIPFSVIFDAITH